MDYVLEIDKAVEKIRQTNAKLVCIQLPDGLKPKAKEIQQQITQQVECEILIWAGSCFGACDVPLELENLNVDLLIQFGHSEWK